MIICSVFGYSSCCSTAQTYFSYESGVDLAPRGQHTLSHSFYRSSKGKDQFMKQCYFITFTKYINITTDQTPITFITNSSTTSFHYFIY